LLAGATPSNKKTVPHFHHQREGNAPIRERKNAAQRVFPTMSGSGKEALPAAHGRAVERPREGRSDGRCGMQRQRVRGDEVLPIRRPALPRRRREIRRRPLPGFQEEVSMCVTRLHSRADLGKRAGLPRGG
jgi:hypothetical protein